VFELPITVGLPLVKSVVLYANTVPELNHSSSGYLDDRVA